MAFRQPPPRISWRAMPFNVPATLSVHVFCRCLLRASWLGCARDAAWTFITASLLVHTNTASAAGAFLRLLDIDPSIRRFVSVSAHSHHGRFIDPRPIGCDALPDGFRKLRQAMASEFLRQLSADFTELLTRPLSPPSQSEYQGRRFGALPPRSAFRVASSPRPLIPRGNSLRMA